jgi:hypothetical protein
LNSKNNQECNKQPQEQTLPLAENQVTLTELVPVTTDNVFGNEQRNQENISSFHGNQAISNVMDQSVNMTVQLSDIQGPSGFHSNKLGIEQNNYLLPLTDNEQCNQEIDSNSVNNIIPVTMTTVDPTNSLTKEQALYNFAAIQQGLADYFEGDQGETTKDSCTNEIIAGPDDDSIADDTDVSSLSLREAMVLSLERNQEYQVS